MITVNTQSSSSLSAEIHWSAPPLSRKHKWSLFNLLPDLVIFTSVCVGIHTPADLKSPSHRLRLHSLHGSNEKCDLSIYLLHPPISHFSSFPVPLGLLKYDFSRRLGFHSPLRLWIFGGFFWIFKRYWTARLMYGRPWIDYLYSLCSLKRVLLPSSAKVHTHTHTLGQFRVSNQSICRPRDIKALHTERLNWDCEATSAIHQTISYWPP